MLLVTVVVQFTAKTTNSEKAIYFLSPMSYSIHKLKSHMLFTCKHFLFSDFTRKKIDVLFFTLNNFQQNLKKHMFFDYNDVNFNVRPSLLK